MRELSLSELEVVRGGFSDPNLLGNQSLSYKNPFDDPWKDPWDNFGDGDDCPGSVEECKDNVDTLIDSMQDTCREMDSARDRAQCWAETEKQRADKYRECEDLYG